MTSLTSNMPLNRFEDEAHMRITYREKSRRQRTVNSDTCDQLFFSSSLLSIATLFSSPILSTEGILQFEDDSDALLSWNDRIAELCAEVCTCLCVSLTLSQLLHTIAHYACAWHSPCRIVL